MATETIQVATKCWRLTIFRHYGDSWNLDDYLVGFAQIDDKIKQILHFRFVLVYYQPIGQ